MTQLALCFVNNGENLIKVTVCKIVLEGKTLPLNKKYNLKVSVCFTCLQIHVTCIDDLTCLEQIAFITIYYNLKRFLWNENNFSI